MKVFDVIKNDKSSSKEIVLWKFSGEDFLNNSRLIVDESEVAMFVSDGHVLQTFPAGAHTLTTNNFPFLANFRKKLSAFKSCFNSKIYFVSQTISKEIKWGTEAPILVKDITLNTYVGIISRGFYRFQVDNPKKFLLKQIGNNIHRYTYDDVKDFLRFTIISAIKNYVTEYIAKHSLPLLELEMHCEDISEGAKNIINLELEVYGLKLVDFRVVSVSVDPNDPSTIELKKTYTSLSKKRIQGEDWSSIVMADTLTESAKNSNIISAQALSGGSDIVSALKDSPTSACPTCGAKHAKSHKFCPECGSNMQRIECDACHHQLTADKKFCPECGKEVKR